MMMPKTYTSRSRIETFQECPRRGYINFLWDGRGLVKRGASVYLSTGSYTHMGLEYIFKVCYSGFQVTEDTIDNAVNLATTAYLEEIKERGFDLEEGEDKANELYIIREQCALVEAFIRSFAIRVLPDLLNLYRVVDVEKEEAIEVGELVIQGRIDAILEEKATGDLYIVSFKTAAGWDKRQEKANEHDNQGLSETYLLENRLREENKGIEDVIVSLGLNKALMEHIKIDEATRKYLNYINKFKKKEQVMGVIMIYMLKGKRYESSTPGLWQQHSPLIRAYRKLIGTDYEYAPSLYFDNPQNKSGKGRLGKGWEPFTVWDCEEVGGVKGWIEKLARGEGGGDIIGESFKIPAPYFRNQEHINSWYRQTVVIEHQIAARMEAENNPNVPWSHLEKRERLDYIFDQARKHCHYPTDCSFLKICYNVEVFNDPIGSGEFVYRKPHHKMEEEEHDKLFNVLPIKTITNNKANSEEESKGISLSNTTDNNKSSMENRVDSKVSVLDKEIIVTMDVDNLDDEVIIDG